MSHSQNQYHREGLYETIIQALEAQGTDLAGLKSSDLWPVDQFHVGGAVSTRNLGEKAGLKKHMAVLDVGSGLGGPARILAEEFGCMVTGIDLTPVYVEIAGKLSQLVGLQHQTRFQVASALELPFAGESFDRVWTQHVQMNIEDKPALYRELKRVLIPGGRLIFYDIFKGTTKGVIYPTPWSDRGFNSHLFHISDLQKILKSLGFTSLYQEDHTEFGIDFFQNQMKAAPSGNKPKLALHLLMGDQGSIKLKNVLQNLQNAAIELHSGIFRKSA